MSRRTRILAFAAVAALGLTWWLSVRDQVNLPLPDLSSVEPEVRDHLERVRADALAHPNFESLMQLGRSYQAQGIIEETLAVYRLAEACGDDPFEPLYLRAVIQQTRDLEDARVSLETALAARPASIHALVRMGETLVQLERPLEAEQYYRRALAIDPEDAGAWLGIGRVEMARKNSLEARRALQKSLEVNPKDGTAWSLLATLLQREGRRDEARKAGDRGRGLRGNRAKLDPYTDAVHAANPSSSGLRWRANVAASRGQLEEASRLMVETLKRRPNDASAWVEFGLIQLQQRRFEDARRSARKARELEPDSAGACELEATAFGLEGRVPEAITTLRKGLEAQPESISLMASLAAAIYPTEPDEALK
ncbi:MAG: tetratricopeptide repeat protein, partial [Planctomycetes bacterium]|nr:tetratricopeptide repeat protein [Planctomycetota bacterium]